MIRQTKLKFKFPAATAAKKLNGSSQRRNRQFVMNVYKDQYQKFWQVAKAVGVIIYLELKHKMGMEGAGNFYTIANSMLEETYSISRQRKYYAIKKLVAEGLIKVSKRRGKNIKCKLVMK